MNHCEIDNLKEGTKIYFYSQATGIIVNEYKNQKDKLHLYELSEDKAMITWVKNSIKEFNDKINKSQNIIDKCLNSIEQINQEFNYLKEKYPEEFI